MPSSMAIVIARAVCLEAKQNVTIEIHDIIDIWVATQEGRKGKPAKNGGRG